MSSADDVQKTCNTETEPAWFVNFKTLFCSLSPFPKGSEQSGTRFNAMTRLVVYVTFILLLCKFKHWHVFLIGSCIFLGIIYYQYTSKRPSENFAILSQADLKTQMNTNAPPVVYNTDSNGKKLIQPTFEVPLAYQVAQITSPDIENQLRLNPVMTKNQSNSFLYDASSAINTSKEAGQRDPQAGIQYFTPKVGVNRKTMIEPVIAPRICDLDYWGKQSTVHSDVNKVHITDITNQDINTYDMAQIPDRYPYAQGYKVGYPLGLPVEYKPRVPGAVWNMNPVGQDPDIGFFTSSQDLYNSSNYQDFDRTYLPIYQNPKSYVVPNIDMNPVLQANTTPMYYPWDKPITSNLPATQYYGVTEEQVLDQEGAVPSYPVREGFNFLNVDGGRAMPAQLDNYLAQPAQYPLPTPMGFNTPGDKTLLGGGYTELGRVPPGQNAQIPAVTDQLMYQSPTYSYNANYFDSPNSKLFLQTTQPQLYSYNVEQTPINNNIGIAYAPQKPPRVLDQVVNNGMAMPLYSRVDPQLIRTDGTPGQQARQPTRTDWSAEYSNFQAPAGSINFEDIYDPRFTSYGDPYRSYTDVNLGQVQYYYSDVDAYKMPNFISRSNVDFVDFRNPNGQIWPEYIRNASVDEVRSHVENQVTADELFHREDLMSLQMEKDNRRRWQLRYAPINNNNSFH